MPMSTIRSTRASGPISPCARPRASATSCTFRDPKDRSDWWLELTNATSGKARVVLNRAYEDNPAIRWAIRRLDGRFCAAAFLNDKLERVYGFDAPLDTLPTPIEIPAEIEKSATPLVAFVGRLDRRKRPERFFACARFPHVQFVAAGASHDKAWGNSSATNSAGSATSRCWVSSTSSDRASYSICSENPGCSSTRPCGKVFRRAFSKPWRVAVRS